MEGYFFSPSLISCLFHSSTPSVLTETLSLEPCWVCSSPSSISVGTLPFLTFLLFSSFLRTSNSIQRIVLGKILPVLVDHGNLYLTLTILITPYIKVNGRSLVSFHKRLLLPLNMCIDIQNGLAHMWEPILESKRYHILISDFIFKSQFLPRSKISNPLRFWISIDLNILESFLEEKCVQFLIFF